uniref:Uncharacterized protein n=1 Tax=Ditylenchus dipsaci TaxID=166011 RepID=A0A915CVM0_9BILA
MSFQQAPFEDKKMGPLRSTLGSTLVTKISGLALGISSRSTSLPAQRLRITRKAIMETKRALQNESAAGEWIACFKDLQHSEEFNAYDVFEGRQPPRPQSELCQQLTEELVTAEVYFDNVLEHQVEDENFQRSFGAICSAWGI